jgi:hypothetical protein
MDLRETGWDSMGWIHQAQDRGKWWALVSKVMNPGFIKCCKFLEYFRNY